MEMSVTLDKLGGLETGVQRHLRRDSTQKVFCVPDFPAVKQHLFTSYFKMRRYSE